MGNKLKNKTSKLLIAFTFLFNLVALPMTEVVEVEAEPVVDQDYSIDKQVDQTLGFIVETVPNPTFGTAGGEWSVLSLARGEYPVPDNYYDIYYENVVDAVQELMPANNRSAEGRLDRNKGSEHSRLIIGLTAIGENITDVGGYNILEALGDYNFMTSQGINGPIFALIALDTYGYEIPQVDAPVQATRQMYIDYILDREIADGGWALFGNNPDPDITAMAIQGLTPYMNQEEVNVAVGRAIEWLSLAQEDDGGYASWGSNNSESTSQVIVALTGLGIDPHTDERFVKNGYSVIDALMTFAAPNGGFMHVKPEGASSGGAAPGLVDGMATDQAAYALVAYQRFLNGQNRLYDMTDVAMAEGPGIEDPGTEDPVAEDPGIEGPGAEDLGAEDLGAEDPVAEDPGTEDPGTEDPGTEDPESEDPGTEDPGTEGPQNDEEVETGEETGNREEINSGEEAEIEESDKVLPKTGETSNVIVLALGIMLISGGLVLAKKSKHNN